MPSAVKKEEMQNLPIVSADDPIGQIKQAANNKVRNLEKRKNKLEALKEDGIKGKPLTEEQKLAVQHIDDVDRQIEIAKEFVTNITSVEISYNKQMKALKKKEEKEKVQTEILRLRELLRLQDTLNFLGNEVVRQDFLSGNNGALKFSPDEMKRYDDIYKKLCPTREDLSEGQVWSQVLEDSAQFAHNLIISLSKPAPGFESMTYKQLKECVDTLGSCSYFEKSSRVGTPENVVVASEGSGDEHRRIEPTNSFDSSEHSATPSLYSSNVNNAVNGSNNNQHEPQPQRSRSPEVVQATTTINFLQEDQTGTHPNPVPLTFVQMPAAPEYAYNFAANQQQINPAQVDAYQNYNQIFPEMTNVNVAVSAQQNQMPRDQNAPSMLFVSQQSSLTYTETPMVSSAANTTNQQKPEMYNNNNSEVAQGHPDSNAPVAPTEFGHRGHGGRGGGYRARGGRGGEGFRGSGRGGGWRGGRHEGSYENSNDYRNERSDDGGYRRGGGGGPRGGRGYDGGYRRGSGGYRGGSGGPYRGSERGGNGGDRPRGRGGFRGGYGGARGGGSFGGGPVAAVGGQD